MKRATFHTEQLRKAGVAQRVDWAANPWCWVGPSGREIAAAETACLYLGPRGGTCSRPRREGRQLCDVHARAEDATRSAIKRAGFLGVSGGRRRK